MSLIFITKHDENIYNITAKPERADQHKKPSRQHKRPDRFGERAAAASREHIHTKLVQDPTHQHHKAGHATMGLPEGDPPDPKNYLKKHTGNPSYTANKTHVKQGRICKKLNLPHKGETPLIKDMIEAAKTHEADGDSGDRNFIKENVKAAKSMKPKEPEHRVITDRFGCRMYPEAQGLEPVHIKKPIFGHTPMYLVRFNKIKEKEYQMKKDMSGKQQPKCRYITRDEREQLLNGLKKNWEELQKQYQGLPILTDTIPKKVKKSKLEADLKQIEKDIVLIERHPYIYVYDDSDQLAA